jgi:hypothetical protein
LTGIDADGNECAPPSFIHLMRFRFLCALLALTNPAVSLAAATVPSWDTPPGWTQTRGGSGGTVVRVTTLAAEGPGSFAAALAANEARIIHFSVAGHIDLGGKAIRLTKPYVTVAGETAPSPGITLTNGGLLVAAHDVIIRHLSIRPGAGERPKKSGWEIDGLCTTGGAHDVIIDHCSLTWATDENLSASGPRFGGDTPDEWRKNTSHRVTFSHNIIAECLHDSAHGKGPHSCGTLVHDNASDIAIVGNLYLSNNYRNPLFKGGARGAVVNNVIQNPGRSAIVYVLEPPEWEGRAWQRGALVVVGNVVRRGPSTTREFSVVEANGPCDLFLRDNLLFDAAGKSLPAGPRLGAATGRKFGEEPTQDAREVSAPPFWPPDLDARPASETLDWILAGVGARPWDRSPIDQRLIAEARAGTGKIIHYESEVGGLR